MNRLRELIQKIKQIDWKKHESRMREVVQKRPLMVGGCFLGLLLLFNLFSLGGGKGSHLVEHPKEANFQNGRILNDRESTFYYGKERLLSQKAQTMIEQEAKLEARLLELEKKIQEGSLKTSVTATPQQQSVGVAGGTEPQANANSSIQLYPPASEVNGGTVTPLPAQRGHHLGAGGGAGLISFPVKLDTKNVGVVLPSGSYVKAKMMTGVDVPEGKPYPVLLALDFSYVAPNEQKIDLSGCFMIAKAQGDLSTERVQMQATKMSCVSKKGKMFEREVNGFIADNKDASFAVSGVVNSKQGRVAAMAFMSSIVQGVGQAVQAAQTSQNVNPLGGSSSVLTGDSTKYMVAGGASNAAGMVAQWYLQQAQSLSPTVSVGSGHDVWIIMNDKVDLPQEFFRKEGKPNEGIYTYLSRFLD